MSKDHNTITCTHGKGLACPVCYDQTHNLSQCGDACNCMKCNPSKSSCIALRASELNMPHVDVIGSELPRVERFGDLPDGTLFYLAQTYAYGGRKKLIKTLEDGGPHNAVYNEYGGIGIQLRNEQLVFRA